jgi:acetylornithine/N-succinyldiaminopimelate aminotransferase
LKKSDEYKRLAGECLTPNYGNREVVLARASGARVWDTDGREYLDFLAGISVNNLGHCPPAVVKALQKQAEEIMHCSNLYLIPAQVELAARLCELSFAERCFFANSGAEVNEAAVKLARLYSRKKHGRDDRFDVITMRNSFHGRTLAMITATGQEKVQKGFEPLMPGFKYAVFNDIESVRGVIDDHTCAIMVEPVQGEGGITPATAEFLGALREECDKRDMLLIYDEVQSGMGRCGKLFAYEVTGVVPDVLTLAKALGNGFPIGAMLTKADIAAVLEPGTHGSTFGGNPLACAVAKAVLDEMIEKDIPARSEEMGRYFRAALAKRLEGSSIVKEVRGHGLMVGVELTQPGMDVVKTCLDKGLLINCTMNTVLRLLPPLTVTREECDRAAEIVAAAVGELETSSANAATAVTSAGGAR